MDIDHLKEREVKGERVQHPKGFNSYFYYVKFGNCRYVPLVIRPMEYVCELDIQCLRRENPGQIVHGGDLDNRLKTLFDALRIPLHADHAPTTTGNEITTCFCLLEDDALITDLTVKTGVILGPISEGKGEFDVDLTMRVLVKMGLY